MRILGFCMLSCDPTTQTSSGARALIAAQNGLRPVRTGGAATGDQCAVQLR